MAAKAFLTRIERHDLARYAAGVGENYDKYVAYAKKREWPIYTRGSYRNWVQRSRRLIWKYREQYVEEVRKLSMFDRERRLQELEDSIAIINSHLIAANSQHTPHSCLECGLLHEIAGPEVAIKLMEQKRKLLEQIAKERNEWMKPVDEVQQNDARTLLRTNAMEVLSKARETAIVDGKIIVAIN